MFENHDSSERIALLEDQLSKAVMLLQSLEADRATFVERLNREFRDRYELERRTRMSQRQQFLERFNQMKNIIQNQARILELYHPLGVSCAPLPEPPADALAALSHYEGSVSLPDAITSTVQEILKGAWVPVPATDPAIAHYFTGDPSDFVPAHALRISYE